MTLLTHVIQRKDPGQTRIILYPDLTRTKRDPDDPGDPTRFQRWYRTARYSYTCMIIRIAIAIRMAIYSYIATHMHDFISITRI